MLANRRESTGFGRGWLHAAKDIHALADGAGGICKKASNDASSLRLDVRCLEDWPPLLDLGFLQRAELLRRLTLAREDLLPEVGQSRSHGWVGQGIDGG